MPTNRDEASITTYERKERKGQVRKIEDKMGPALVLVVSLLMSHDIGAFSMQSPSRLPRSSSRGHMRTMPSLNAFDSGNNEALAQKTFEAQITPEMMMSFSALTAILIGTAFFWWTTIIPQQRTNLAVQYFSRTSWHTTAWQTCIHIHIMCH